MPILLYLLGGLAAVAAAGGVAWWKLSDDEPIAPRLPPPEPSKVLPASSHRAAAEALRLAWEKVFPGEAPTLGALQILAGIGALEGAYGKGTYRNKKTGESASDTWNWGAIQGSTVDPATGRIGGFLASDYNPKTGEWYEASYQRYASAADGAAALIRLVAKYAPEAIRAGNILRTSKQMYTGEVLDPSRTLAKPLGYYQGIVRPKGSSPEAHEEAAWANIRAHSKKIFVEAAAFAAANEQPLEAYLEDLDWYLAPQEAA